MRISGGLSAVYDPSDSSLSWLDKLSSFGQVALNLELMRDLNEINLERARKGLPPLSPSEYSPQVNVGVASDTRNTALMLGGMGLIGLLGVALLARRRR